MFLARFQLWQRMPQMSSLHRSQYITRFRYTVCASKAEKLAPAEPASVKEYYQHILIQTAPLKSDQDARQQHSAHGSWWPSVVEKHPAAIEAITAAAASKASTKVTLYEEISRDTFLEAGRPVCDLRIYPAGVQYTDLPIDKIRHVMSSHVQDDDYDDEEEEAATSNQAEPLEDLQQSINGIHLYVCCHGSRDTRCGNIGNRLAHALDRLVREQQMQGKVQVFKCSHVGGHKFAGNVLVYGAISPCDGDWFGSVNQANAPEFLDAILNTEVGSEGGSEHPDLRHLWRGRMGLSKQEQLDLFAGKIASEEDSSDVDDMQPNSQQAIQASIRHAQWDKSSSTHNASCRGTAQTVNGIQQGCLCQSGNTAYPIHARDTSDEDETDLDSRSSDADTSSDSGSGSDLSESEGSDDDPDVPSPILLQ